MKTAVISLYESFPPVSGAASVSYNLAKHMPWEKYLIQVSRKKDSILKDTNIHLINLRIFLDKGPLKGIFLFYQFRKILRKLKQIKPNVVILEGATWTVYLLILFYLMKLYRVDAKIIYHAHNVEFLLRKQKNNVVIARVTKWAEGHLVSKANVCTAVSKKDAVHFERLYEAKPLILPNGVDIGVFDSVPDVQVKKIKSKYNLTEKNVLFMGLTTFKPNKDAIDFLVHDVFPSVVKRCPEAKLVIIGGKVKYKRSWLLNPGILPFEEVPAFVKACDVCVAPVFSGSGTRIKILEYMAANKPVISTTKGAEGISIKAGETIVIADPADKFVENVLCLLKETDWAEKIGREGRELVRAYYAWPKIMKDFTCQMDGIFSGEAQPE